MPRGLALWPFDHTGEVIGGASKQPCPVQLDGWIINNTAGATAAVSFYAPVGNVNGDPLLPSAAGTLLFVIELAANTSKEFVFPDGVICKDGLFVQSSATTCTGVIVYH